MGLRAVVTYEEVRKMTVHTTNKAFDRYLQIEGEAMKKLYSRRNDLINFDKKLTNGNIASKGQESKCLQ